jgi:hypothetical protein
MAIAGPQTKVRKCDVVLLIVINWQVSLKAAVDYPALAAGKEHNLLAMLEIQAPKFEEESRRSRGIPLS